MTIKKIVFLLEQPFDSRNYDRFGIEILRRNGFEVCVYDCTPLRFPNRKREEPVRNLPASVRVVELHSEQEMLAALAEIGCSAFVINFIGYNPDTYPIYKALSVLGIRYAVTSFNALPIPENESGFGQRIKRLITPDGQPVWRRLTRAGRNYLYRRRSGDLKGATLWFAGGSDAPAQYFYPHDKDTRILWLHSLDYDLYLTERDREVEITDTAVFLDQYLPFHPDFFCEGRRSPVPPKRYYPRLNGFFDELEKKTGLKTEVAGHPRAVGDHAYRNYFGGRTVIYGDTVTLIRKAKLVIAHYTTAVNLAVLFRKPIAFVMTRELQESDRGPQIEVMAKSLGKEVIDLEDPFLRVDWKEELEIDDQSYADYQRRFISTERAPETVTWQIVADALKQIAI